MYNEWPMSNVVNAPIDLRDRTLAFSRAVIGLLKGVKKDSLVEPIKIQLIRSATSIGANFVEAKNASSKKDFRNKVFISKKEASETFHWLQLLEEFSDSKEITNLQNECQEIIFILQEIITTLDH